jgi:hypothetical protein
VVVLDCLDAVRNFRCVVEPHVDCCLQVGAVRSRVEGALEIRELRGGMEGHSVLPTREGNAVDVDWEPHGLGGLGGPGGLGGLGMVQMEEVAQLEHPSEAVQPSIEPAELEHEGADGQVDQLVADEVGECSQPVVGDDCRC